MRPKVVLFAAVVTAAFVRTAASAELQFDHVWIVVTREAPERAALERAGLKISPDRNRHDGQGTASITTEFLNSYIELMWPDPTVSVAPGLERAVEKFKNRMNWRTSGRRNGLEAPGARREDRGRVVVEDMPSAWAAAVAAP